MRAVRWSQAWVHHRRLGLYLLTFIILVGELHELRCCPERVEQLFIELGMILIRKSFINVFTGHGGWM